MKTWVLFAVVGLAAVTYGGYNLYEYHEWKVAYVKALDAYKRAYDYRDAGTLLYEPRRKDLDAAMDDLERQPLPVYYSDHKRAMLRICVGGVSLYRETANVNLELSRLGKIPDMANQRSIEKDAGSCIVDAIAAGDMP